jgi:hypothetical protein
VAGNRQPNRARNAGKRIGPRDREVLPDKSDNSPAAILARNARRQVPEAPLPSTAEMKARERRSDAASYARAVRQVQHLRAALAGQELYVVRMGRERGTSWDRIGAAVGVPGETLRRRYAGKL